MAFVQVMEFEMEPAEAVRLLEQYAEEGKGITYARRAVLGLDLHAGRSSNIAIL